MLFVEALDREARIVPKLDGSGFVDLNRLSQRLTRRDIGALIDGIHAWGARNGVVFRDTDGI